MSFSQIKCGLFRGRNEHDLTLDITYGPVFVEGDMEFQEVWGIYVALGHNERGSVYITHTETLEQAIELAETLTDDDIPFGWSRKSDPEDKPLESVTDIAHRVCSDLREKSNSDANPAMKEGQYYMGYQMALDEVFNGIVDDQSDDQSEDVN